MGWADPDRWDVVYARVFENQPEGHALYKKFTVDQLKPGTCGFFDEQGDWEQIADLTNKEELEKAKYTFLPGIVVTQDPGKEGWDLRKSDNVHKFELGGAADANVPGAGGGGVALKYECSSDEGAIILTQGKVTHVQARPASVACQWLIDNGRAVLEKNPDAKKKGIWIVTKTYHVPRRKLALMTSKGESVTFSADANVYPAKVRATAGFWQQNTGGAWNTHEYQQGVVLAFDGIFWKDKWWSTRVKPVTNGQKKFLGGEGETRVLGAVQFEIPEGKNEEDAVEMVPEIKGAVGGVTIK